MVGGMCACPGVWLSQESLPEETALLKNITVRKTTKSIGLVFTRNIQGVSIRIIITSTQRSLFS